MTLAELVRSLLKPQYVFRPVQLVRRVAWRSQRRGERTVTAPLAWGMPITCFAGDSIGLGIQQLGVFELTVSEALWRLAEPGETALDVGANVGQMTGLLSLRLGPSGRVIAFEPGAEVRDLLERNVAAWRAGWPVARTDVESAALSDHDGEGELLIPPYYEWNRGLASVAAGHAPAGGERRRIRLARLDSVVPDRVAVGVMKVDVEGHERAVLQGAQALLAAHRIRDIVYEDHGGYPTDVSRILESHGYHVFSLRSRLWGPRLEPADGTTTAPAWESPNFVATLDPLRARTRLAPRGWRVLGARRA
jgi:FkbM family methyltransferase